ncbi:MAG TPA: OmpA family protein [Chthoniobacterales bacterium]
MTFRPPRSPPNPRRGPPAKTPRSVWVVVGLGVAFALGGFGSSAFIVVKALVGQKKARLAAPLATPGGPLPADSTPAPKEDRPPAPLVTAVDVPSPGRPEEDAVRQEVLRRIDLMRTLSDKAKDQLYMEVERAQFFSKIAVLNFATGKSSLPQNQPGELRQTLSRPAMQRLLEDPTVVLVVLGYADPAGDEGKNLEISKARAETVVRLIREQLGSKGVMHAIGMGGQNLIDKENRDKNRAVEVWAVLP